MLSPPFPLINTAHVDDSDAHIIWNISACFLLPASADALCWAGRPVAEAGRSLVLSGHGHVSEDVTGRLVRLLISYCDISQQKDS